MVINEANRQINPNTMDIIPKILFEIKMINLPNIIDKSGLI